MDPAVQHCLFVANDAGSSASALLTQTGIRDSGLGRGYFGFTIARLLLSMVVVTVGHAFPAMAAPTRFAGTASSDFQIIAYTDGGSHDLFQSHPATRYSDVLLDPVALTSFYRTLRYSFDGVPAYTFQMQRQVTGTFTFVPISLSITLNPIEIEKVDYGPNPLSLRSGTTFVEPGQFQSSQLFAPLNVSGHYSVSGPTQSFSGDFSYVVPPLAVSGFGINVANFPQSISQARFNLVTSFDGTLPYLFNGTIDGAPLDVRLRNFGFDAQNLSYSTLYAVPPVAGDLNGDDIVDIFDVNVVSAHWGSSGPAGDANGDMIVDIFDVNFISAHWTPTPVPAARVTEPAAFVLAASVLFGVAVWFSAIGR